MNNFGYGSIDDLLKKRPARLSTNSTTPTNMPPMPEEEQEDDASSSSSPAQFAVAKKMEEIRLSEEETETQTRAAAYTLPYIDLEGFPIGPEILSLISEDQARAHQVLPFFRLDNEMRLGVVNPDDPGVHDIVAQLQHAHDRAHIVLYLISPHSFMQAVKLYKNVAKVITREYGVKITPDQLQKYQTELSSFSMLEQKIVQSNMTDAFAMIISMALNADSSDVHIEAEEGSSVIRFRIDGVLVEVAHIPTAILTRLVNRIKAIAELKMNVTEIPQDGRISIKMGKGGDLDIRVSTLPSAFGESIVFRLLKSSSVGLTFEQLGMRPPTYARLKAEMEKPNGMIITTGPTGSGKTTTLYAILNTLNDAGTKIITLENPVEYKLKGIVQSQIDHSKNYTFALGLRAILRQDPDIVMVGEIRDLETAQTAVDAALTGHLLLSTIHTNDAAGAVPRFLGMGVQGIFLAPALNAVIGQRLVRRVCSQCKQEYTPSAEERQKMKEWIERIPENSGEVRPDISTVKFYKGAGCGVCAKTGYKGRVGIYEVFTMLPEIEQQILSGAVSEYQMKEILHRAGMVTMGQDGMLKVIDGLTTLDEVFRVAKE
ncbi:MAG: type II/IV secretion system protein [Candidatus Kerfeldbacteria bacterium]|nr:type II/IV secretion system protein [Candidatus Kerfeldbacteria bacterium]